MSSLEVQKSGTQPAIGANITRGQVKKKKKNEDAGVLLSLKPTPNPLTSEMTLKSCRWAALSAGFVGAHTVVFRPAMDGYSLSLDAT